MEGQLPHTGPQSGLSDAKIRLPDYPAFRGVAAGDLSRMRHQSLFAQRTAIVAKITQAGRGEAGRAATLKHGNPPLSIPRASPSAFGHDSPPPGQMDVPGASPEGAQKGGEQKHPWLGMLQHSPLPQGWSPQCDRQAKDTTPSFVGMRHAWRTAKGQSQEQILGASLCPRTVAPSQTEAGEGGQRGESPAQKAPPTRKGPSAAQSPSLQAEGPDPFSLPPFLPQAQGKSKPSPHPGKAGGAAQLQA